MAVRGSVAKEEFIAKLHEFFPNLIMNGKEIRIPWMENGEEVQLKIALTAAKENIAGSVPVEYTKTETKIIDDCPAPTAEEKKRVQELLNKLSIM